MHDRSGADRGSAIVEFTFLALLVMVPLVYLVVAVAAVQRSSSAAGEAARAGGRALATADSIEQGEARADAAIRITLQDQGIRASEAQVRIVDPGSSCDGTQVVPSLDAGAQYALCVIYQAKVPGVPTILGGRSVRTVGRYVIHIDDFR